MSFYFLNVFSFMSFRSWRKVMLSHQSEELRKKMRGKARGEAAAQKIIYVADYFGDI